MNKSEKITFEDPDWERLAESIGEGEAVLLLGPDALPMYRMGEKDNNEEPSELTFSQLARFKIMQNKDVKYSYFYERDNLFLFRDSNAKKEARKTVRQCANDKQWMPDSELLQQVAAIPFSLIISVNPDTFIRDTFDKLGIQHQFDFYSTKDKEHEVKLGAPTANKPLIYNICGCTEDIQSVILDYNDLFALLRNMLNDLKIPDVLRPKLRRTDTYILLGFHFERWYFQLLLHYLNMLDGEFDNSNKTFSILSELSENDTRQFMMQQFNLKWIAPSREDFEKLYAACAKKKILRPIDLPQSAIHADMRQRIARNDVLGAFQLLENAVTDTDTLTMLTLLRARHSAWHQASKQGTEDIRDLTTEINQIRYTLLSLAAQMPYHE